MFSTVLDMQLEESLKMNKSINLNASSIELYKCLLNDPKSRKITILENFDISLIISTTPNIVEKILINVDQMKFTFAKQDYLFIKLLQEKWQSVINEKPLKIPEKKDEGIQMQNDYPEFVRMIDLKLEGISIRLVDDFDGNSVPLISVNLSNLNSEIITSSEIYNYLKVKARTNIFIDYFNINNQSWEPMLR